MLKSSERALITIAGASENGAPTENQQEQQQQQQRKLNARKRESLIAFLIDGIPRHTLT